MPHHKNVFARAFADVATHVERNALDVAVHDGFHLDELRVHVVGARFRHGRHGVRRQSVPGRDADIGAFISRAQIFAPLVVGDVHVYRAVQRIHTNFAVSAQHDRPDVAGNGPIQAHQLQHGGHQLFAGVVHVNAINLGRIQQPLPMLIGTKNGAAALGLRVATDALENRRAIIHHV